MISQDWGTGRFQMIQTRHTRVMTVPSDELPTPELQAARLSCCLNGRYPWECCTAGVGPHQTAYRVAGLDKTATLSPYGKLLLNVVIGSVWLFARKLRQFCTLSWAFALNISPTSIYVSEMSSDGQSKYVRQLSLRRFWDKSDCPCSRNCHESGVILQIMFGIAIGTYETRQSTDCRAGPRWARTT